MSPTKDLPVELIEYIIDMLDEEPQTLKACTLVCHRWLTRARYNLFAKLNLDLRAVRVMSDESTMEDKVASFQQSSLPLFNIQHLELWSGNFIPGMLLWPCWAQLENVTELHLQWFDLLDEDLRSFLAHTPRLKRLSIKGAQFTSPTKILYMLQPALYLSELELHHIFWELHRFGVMEPSNNVLHHYSPTPLQHLILNEIQHLDSFVAAILNQYPDLALRSLWTSSLASDRALMSRCYASLQTLDLRCEDLHSFDFNLTRYESLQTLVMSEVTRGQITPEFFATIRPENFRNLVLSFVLDAPRQLVSRNRETFDWASIDAGMDKFHPSALVLVAIEGLGRKELADLESECGTRCLIQLLPRCVRRGAVRVYPCDATIWSDLHVYYYQ